jgi:hypothetical protein
MTVSMKVDLKDFNKLIDRSKGVTDAVALKAYTKFRQSTPIKTGNARSHTTLDKGSNTIYADYPYAQRLDDGWSKQAPEGMVNPTIAFIETLVEQEIRKQNGL